MFCGTLVKPPSMKSAKAQILYCKKTFQNEIHSQHVTKENKLLLI